MLGQLAENPECFLNAESKLQGAQAAAA